MSGVRSGTKLPSEELALLTSESDVLRLFHEQPQRNVTRDSEFFNGRELPLHKDDGILVCD